MNTNDILKKFSTRTKVLESVAKSNNDGLIAHLYSVFKGDPYYEDFINAATPSEMKKKADILIEIRGSNAMTRIQNESKKFKQQKQKEQQLNS